MTLLQPIWLSDLKYGQIILGLKTHLPQMTEESFPSDAEAYTIRHLLNGVKVSIIVDTAVSKCFLSNAFYI